MLIGVGKIKYFFIPVKYKPNLHWYSAVSNTTLKGLLNTARGNRPGFAGSSQSYPEATDVINATCLFEGVVYVN